MGIVPYRQFILSDGTTDTDTGILHAVDLLDRVNGFCITDWQMRVTEPKGAGVWADSALADGQFLKVSKLSNVQETITVEIVDFRADGLADRLHLLYDLLEQARNWGPSGWSKIPVWIEAVGVNESNVRYALVHDYRTPGTGYPFGQPFWQAVLQAGIPEFEIVLTREPTWRDNAPGESTALAIGASQRTYGSATTIYGNYDPVSSTIQTSTGREFTYITNKHNLAALTHIYVDDGGAFGGNLLGGNPPYALLPAVPAAGDAVYFGISSTTNPAGPFCSLVFDLSQSGSSLNSIAWEFWNGGAAAWQALTDVQDNTDRNGRMGWAAFSSTGIHSLHWSQDPSWSTSLVNGITAYWVRARVTNAAGGGPAPTQQNRHVYSCLWPYVDIQKGDVAGNVPALVRNHVWSQDTVSFSSIYEWGYNRVIVGVRSVARGEYYSPYINFYGGTGQNFANLAGVTTGTSVGTGDTPVDMTSPTGYAVTTTPAAAAIFYTLLMRSDVCAVYQGTFHLFIRGQQTAGTAGNMSIRVSVALGVPKVTGIADAFYVSDWVAFDSTDPWQVLDFGAITIDTVYGDNEPGNLILYFESQGTGAETAKFYDLILFPIDEWAMDTQDNKYTEASTVGNRRYGPTSNEHTQALSIDGISDPRRFRVAAQNARDTVYGDIIFSNWQGIGAEGPILLPNTRQRLWFFAIGQTSVSTQAHIRSSGSVQMFATNRYLLMRGDK